MGKTKNGSGYVWFGTLGNSTGWFVSIANDKTEGPFETEKAALEFNGQLTLENTKEIE